MITLNCEMANIARVKWKATNIALGQYWFLLLLHGFIPSGPGQYGVLLSWLEEDQVHNVSVLYPPIQEEMGIRRNIALGQYFSGNISLYSHLLLDWGVQYGYNKEHSSFEESGEEIH